MIPPASAPAPSPIERIRATIATWPVPADVEPLRPESSARSGFLSLRLQLRGDGPAEPLLFTETAPVESIHRALDQAVDRLRRRTLTAAPSTC